MTGNKANLILKEGRRDLPDMPDLARLYSMAHKGLASLPEKFKPFVETLLVRVENFADEEIIKNLKLTDKYDLLGLYRGIPLPLKALSSPRKLPDVIYLYRCPLIKYAADTTERVEEIVRYVMLHELGHHFGYSDHDLDWLDKFDDGGRNRD
jgi:predicted Zn-dependent protease with MMP-like domain